MIARTQAAAPELSQVAQDYLKVIWTAQEVTDEPVSTKLLAEKLAVAPSTVSESVRKLAEQGFVDHARYGSISLTESGGRAAVAMVRRHRLIETFLVDELGYGWDEVHDEAEVLEHAVSEQMVARMDAKLGFPEHDPHGDPIPREDGSIPDSPTRRLIELTAGEAGSIARISDADPALLRYFQELGVALGAEVGLVERRDFAGTVTVRLGDAVLELGHPAAAAIWVA